MGREVYTLAITDLGSSNVAIPWSLLVRELGVTIWNLVDTYASQVTAPTEGLIAFCVQASVIQLHLLETHVHLFRRQIFPLQNLEA
jgi:hypothetical protein